VITGASSGIGRAAALAFAARGSGLALAARARAPLEQIAQECEAAGTEAIWLPTDVRDEGQVADLARRAVDRFGRVDVWVNSAGVIAYGRFEDVPADVFRAVIETNLFGHVHAARAALPQFRGQRSGVLINMASVWGRVTSPDVSAYVTRAGNYADRPLAPTAGTILEASAGPYTAEGGWKRDRRRELVRAFTDAARGLARGARHRGRPRS
jgi:NAD(P)-dependent dehydrogenase (short-subunit alcohol dehydrogenase family)